MSQHLKNQDRYRLNCRSQTLNSVLYFTPTFSVVKTKGQYYKEQTKITDHYQDLS